MTENEKALSKKNYSKSVWWVKCESKCERLETNLARQTRLPVNSIFRVADC